ncbi:MAG TPA: DNA internalization-related competence protein ComEC/Rec2 [Candidatus Acidoferrum sp.]|nr:DNA internalization-related competence protein ComEC/Rec2 [Candidatus Acidoferrum sp.]
MKLPAVAIAAAFACGVALGLWPPVVRLATSHFWLGVGFFAAAFLVVVGVLLLNRMRVGEAAVISGASWMLLGVLGAWISERPLPSTHVVNLIENGRIDLRTPLRWHGTLRDEPTKLPWGYGLEVELAGVEYENTQLTALGGLRLSFSARPDDPPLAALHAGDDVTVLAQARRPQVFRDEGVFDRRAYLATQGIDLVATLRSPELIHRLSAAPWSAGTMLARTRHELREEVDKLFDGRPEVAAVLRAMLLGDRSFVERDEAVDFQKTGVFHVLVVAGLHVGALAFFLYWLGRKLRLSRVATMVFTLTLLLAYVAVIEQRPPVLRAALMTAIVVLGSFFYRRLDVLNSAAIAALVLLVARPLAVRDSSFQLTFLAIGCIAGLAAPWLERNVQPYARALRGWRDVTRDAAHEPRAAQFRIDLRSAGSWLAARLPPRIAAPVENALAGGIGFTLRAWELMVLTLALQIGMLPLMARDFHRITLAAPFVNLAAVPLTGIVVPLGFMTLGSALLLPGLARILAAPLTSITLVLLHIVHWFARLPKWSYRVPGPHLWVVVVFFTFALLLAAILRVAHPWQRRIASGLGGGLLACSLLIALFPFSPAWSAGKLEVSVLDVGQGDSLFVVSPHGKTLLIDGGGAFGGFAGQSNRGIDPGEEAVSPYLWSRGFQKINVVALTHAHQDHLGGLAAVLENFRVGQLWIGREVNSPALAKIEQLARDRKIPIEHETRAKSFAWDNVEGKFFWPEISSAAPSATAKNNDSLVLRLRYADRAFLLPGDAEKEAERAMLSEGGQDQMRAEVLKIGHHGSRNSTTPEFLAAVKPRLAIISVGEDNPYGHPNAELLERLANAGVRVLRTDRDGAVHILMDGHGLEVTCFLPCLPAGSDGLQRAQAPDHNKDEEQQ